MHLAREALPIFGNAMSNDLARLVDVLTLRSRSSVAFGKFTERRGPEIVVSEQFWRSSDLTEWSTGGDRFA